MSTKPIGPSYSRSYRWAANPIKLGEAITDLEQAKKLDPSVVIDEETIKARYIVRKGIVLDVQAPEVPEVSNPPVDSEETHESKAKLQKTSKVAKE